MANCVGVHMYLQHIVQVCVWLQTGEELPGREAGIREGIVLRGELFAPRLTGANPAKQGGQWEPECHQVPEEGTKTTWRRKGKREEEETFVEEEAATDFPHKASFERAAGP